MKLSANEETLRHEDVRRRPSGFIMHTTHGETDLGARASKASPAVWDLASSMTALPRTPSSQAKL